MKMICLKSWATLPQRSRLTTHAKELIIKIKPDISVRHQGMKNSPTSNTYGGISGIPMGIGK